MAAAQPDFPLFPLPVVLLPTEVIPLHIFEDRYKTMIALCLEEGTRVRHRVAVGRRPQGDRVHRAVAEVLEEMEDGRMNILVRGGSPFRLLEKQEDHVYPAGHDRAARRPGRADDEEEAGGEARERYADLLERITNERPEAAALAELSAYEMAASVEIDLDVKQGLLELRSEEERLRLLARLFKAGIKRVELARDIADRARQERQGQVQLARNSVDDDRDAAAARVAGARQRTRDRIAARGLRAAEVQVEAAPAHGRGSRAARARRAPPS